MGARNSVVWEVGIYALRQLARRKRRSAAVAAGYTLAAAIITFLTSAVVSSRDSAVGFLEDIGAHAMAYIPNTNYAAPLREIRWGPEPEACCEEGAPPGLDPEWEGFIANNAPAALITESAVEALRRSPNIADAAPYILFRLRAPGGSGEWILGGFDPSRPKAFSATMAAKSQVAAGRFLEPADTAKVMVEQEFAAANNIAVGDKVTMRGREYEVVGIVAPPLRPGKANIYMSLSDLRALINAVLDQPIAGAVSAVLVESKGARYHEAAKKDIKAVLGEKCRITSYGCYRPGSLAMGIHENTALALVFIVAFGMLLTAVKVECASIAERRFDIAVLKAVGWSNSDVVGQVLAETLLLAAAGAAAGCFLGSLAVFVMPAVQAGADVQIKIVPYAAAVVVGFIVPTLAALAAGAAAGAAAVRIRPADMLRRL